MKILALFVLFTNIGVSVFSIDFGVYHYQGIRITDNKLYYYGFVENNEEDKNEEYDIKWETVNNVEYIIFNYTGKFLDNYSQWVYNRPLSKGIKRYLILYGANEDKHGYYFHLYDNNNKLAYSKWQRGVSDAFVPEHILISATSELREGSIVYCARNLLEIDNLKPWVEAKNGPGIGEKIYMGYDTVRNPGGMNKETMSKWKIVGLTISNGFVDYNRPYLYGDNNRVKKLRIYFDNPNDFMDIELEDTPQLQHFHFYERRAGKIQLEILDVYKGDKWDDTCINFIFPLAVIDR